jgi:predicted ATPase/DNA-binding SARP family transcriptional activator
MDVRWRIEMLGGLRAVQGVRVITRFRTQKTAALLAYLAFHLRRGHGSATRDCLIELLWPEADLEAGRHSLSMALSWLRRLLEGPGQLPGTVLITDRASVRLNPKVVSTDLAEFEAALHAASAAGSEVERREGLARAASLYHGELLPGFYESWVLGQREWLAETYFQALGRLVSLLEQAGDLPRALEYARQGVLADPLREEARRDLMRLLAATGQPEAALRQYQALERLLKAELDAQPSGATRALARQIEADPAALLATPRLSPSSSPEPSPRLSAIEDAASSTRTFLLTDVEGSTALWEEHPQAMAAALARYDALAATLVAQHSGALVKHRGEGDSLFAVFPGAGDGVAAALALQRALGAERWPEGIALRVRMALHTGDAVVREGDYLGGAVNRCARFRAAAHGGQILLSRATQELVADHLPEGVSLRDLGECRLKDLVRPEHVFQLLHAELPTDFPPLQSLATRPNNLPAQPTPLIGREVEQEVVRRLLGREEVRLVTLTGPGGTGKTRLGLQVAAELLEAFADGAYFVDLAPIRDPELVLPTIAQALGVREAEGRPLRESLKDYLREKQLLLLLDNFEQVLAAAPRVAELLTAAPRLKVLVTSRAILRLRGEHDFPVPPLALPDRGRLPDREQLCQYAAVALFIQRAVAVRPEFAVTNENAPAVVEICHRLDGLPLAIELAAARIRLLSPEGLLARLEQRLPLLVGGARDLPERQQTLRGAIGWSYDLLNPEEQKLFRRLSAFVGGCTLEAAEAVCNAHSDIGIDLLEGMASLMAQSLLRQEEAACGEPCFTMLETIREYALERLVGSGEAEAIRWQHAQFFLTLAEEAEPKLTSADQSGWLDRLEREHDNLRAALVWLIEREEVEAGLRLGGALREFWYVRGYSAEGREGLAKLLGLAEASAGTAARAKALHATGLLAFYQGDYEAARVLHEESLLIQRELGDKAGIAWSLHRLGWVAACLGDYKAVRAHFEKSLASFQELGNEGGIAHALHGLGMVLSTQGDWEAARALYEQSLVRFQALGDKGGIAHSLFGLGWVAYCLGDYEAVRAFYERSLVIFQELGDKGSIAHALHGLGLVAGVQGDWEAARVLYERSREKFCELGNKGGVAWSIYRLGKLARYQGDYEEARGRQEESLDIFRELGDKEGISQSLHEMGVVARYQGDYNQATALQDESLTVVLELGHKGGILTKKGIAECLAELGRVAIVQRRAERAVRLFGASRALRDALSILIEPPDRADYERHVAAARAALGEEAFAAAWAAGRAVSLDAAVAFALDDSSASSGEAK